MIRRGTPLNILVIAALIAVGVAASWVALAAVRSGGVSIATPMRSEDLGHRVLVIAPHPDDESLATGGTIHHLLAEGAQVKVVIVTAGDSYRSAAQRISGGVADQAAYLKLGEVRHQESLAAAARLGLPSADVISLGYTDGVTSSMWDQNWDTSKPVTSRAGVKAVPYSWAFSQGVAQSGENVATDLESVIKGFRPDTIITSDVYETHPDHATVAAFASYAMDDIGFTGRRLSYVVHFRHYPYPWGNLPAMALNPPPQLVSSDTAWFALPLDASDLEAKTAAVDEYASQSEVADMGLYMRTLVRANELLASRTVPTLASLDTDARPAAGRSTTVAVTPLPVVAPTPGSTRPRVKALLIARGPKTLWIGLPCDAWIAQGSTFRVDLRLFGGGAPSRLDVAVRGTVASVLTPASDSLSPSGVRAEIDGDTMWIAVPADVLAGRTRCMIGAIGGTANAAPVPTAWRDTEL